MSNSIEETLFRPSRPRWWFAIGALGVLWLAVLIDVVLWLIWLNGGFSSKANLLSHVWPYISFGGALAGLLARRMPNILRSLPSIWLLASLAMLHRNQIVPKAAPPPLAGQALRVMTLNLGDSPATRGRALSYFRQRRNVDIFLLQEVHRAPGFDDPRKFEGALRSRLPHTAWLPNPPGENFTLGLGMMSRYPLEGVRPIVFPTGESPAGKCAQAAALEAKVNVRGRRLRLVTAHLCPPALPWMDDWGRETGLTFGSFSGWLKNNSSYEYARRYQLHTLRTLAEGGEEPLILGGDLSTTPSSIDLAQFDGVLKSAFDERGLGFGFTYSLGFIGQRIDHIYFAKGLAARTARVADVDVSDHKPLESVLEILPAK
jgi:endonuclease/exonuclease/phosphatase (EEP) superfamily protein YafD